MFDFLNLIEILFKLAVIAAVIGAGIAYVMKAREASRPRREHAATKARLNRAGIRSDDELSPGAAAQYNLSFMGIPSVRAGAILQCVPQLDPNKPEVDGEVLSTWRVVAYTRQGEDPLDAIELGKGRLIIASGGRAAILYRHDLTALEEKYLEQQRQDAVERGDGVIESFQGHQWNIRGAYGQNMNRQAGGRPCSYIQMLSLHPDLANEVPGVQSAFSTGLFDGEMHDYYDMRAICPQTDQYLYFFYAAGRWHCWIGRLLTEDEARKIEAM